MRGVLEVIDSNLDRLSAKALFAMCFVLIISLGVLDYASGYEISFSVFYLFPVIAGGWYIGKKAAILLSVLSAATWFVSDVGAGHVYSHMAIPVWNSTVRLLFFLIIGYLVAGNRGLLMRERAMSRTDALTGVANSRSFMEAASLELNRTIRQKRELVIAYIDIDNFKKVNDTFGHGTGDALLREVASCISSNLRGMDTVARLGGDEFALMLPETGSTGAGAFLMRVKDALTQNSAISAYTVSFSIGAVICGVGCKKDHCDIERLISEADRLMYDVKLSGKDDLRIKRCEGF